MSRPAMVVIAVLFLTGGCQKEFSPGPSDVINGIVIYEHANFQGDSAQLLVSVADLKDYKGPCIRTETTGGGFGAPVSTTVHEEWDNCLSSIRVAPGWRTRLYRDDDYSGQSFETSSDIPNLQLLPGTCDHDGLNDCVSSIRVFPP